MLSKEELYDLYINQKTSINDFKTKYGISSITLYRYLKKYNIEPNRSAIISKEELYDLYINQDLTMKQIGIKYNCDRKAIARLCQKYGIEKIFLSEEQIKEAFNNSSSYVEMAVKLHTTPSSCSKYCKKYGLKYNISAYDKYHTIENIDLIRNLSENKLYSIREISNCTNIPRSEIAKIIKAHNIKTPSNLGYNILNLNISVENNKILQDKNLLLQFIQDNNIVSANHLAKVMNTSSSTTCKLLVKYNMENVFSHQSSSTEKELDEYISQYYDIETNNRKILDGQEIDIYIPQLKLGIEFNGDYWHSNKFVTRKYHQNKSLLAESKGIFIYHIFEYEWNTKKDKILNQLNNLLGINQFKIGARKCEIREVSNKEKDLFLTNNHLQGEDKSSVKLGLYNENKLVSLMTFCKPRFNKKYEWELSRFCSLANYNVIGGASKLFKYFIENYTPKSIISYSNIAHTKGNLYGNLGFTLMNISDPNYVWIKNGEIYSRYQCQKHKLLEQGFEGNSESDIMRKRNFRRLYDCGNKLWIWQKKGL